MVLKVGGGIWEKTTRHKAVALKSAIKKTECMSPTSHWPIPLISLTNFIENLGNVC